MKSCYKQFTTILILAIITSLFRGCEFAKETDEFNDISSETIIHIPTYEGSGQVTHPDIVLLKDKEGREKYYMAFTPFPYSHDEHENPCILESDNGYEFYEAESGINPLVGPPPSPGWNNDTDLLYDNGSEKFYLFYQETQPKDSQNINLISSYDAVNWSEPKTVVHEVFAEGDNFSVSPALLQKDSLYYMFFVNLTTKKEIRYMISDDIEKWNYDEQLNININTPSEFKPWHIDVIEGDDGTYYMLITGYENNFNYQDLYIATSYNLKDWNFMQEPIIRHSKSFFNSRSTYRSTALVKGNTLAVWFAIKTYDSAWKIGIKKFKLDEIID